MVAWVLDKCWSYGKFNRLVCFLPTDTFLLSGIYIVYPTDGPYMIYNINI